MLTARQQEIWGFLVDYVDRHGYPPTVREIGEAVGLASPSTVHAHLANLERAGLLRRDPTKPRALDLIGHRRSREEPAAPATSCGSCHCSARSRQAVRCSPRRTSRSELAVPEPLGRGADFLLRVKGESMVNAGILDGDILVVHRQQDARNGDIVVALAGDDETADEATVKTFYREADRVRLQPENDALEPIYATHVADPGQGDGGASGACDRRVLQPHARPGTDRDRARREPRVPRLRRVPFARESQSDWGYGDCMSRMRIEPRGRSCGNRGRRAGAALVGLTAALALASGCGGEDEPAASTLPADPATALTQSAAKLRQQGTFTFEASFTRVKAAAPDDVEEYATAEGAINLPAGEGRAELELANIFPEGMENPLGDEPVRYRWSGHLADDHALGPDAHDQSSAQPRQTRRSFRGIRTRSSRSTTCSRNRSTPDSWTVTAAPRTTHSRTTPGRRPARHPGRTERRLRAGALRPAPRARGMDRGRRPAAQAQLRDPPEAARGPDST